MKKHRKGPGESIIIEKDRRDRICDKSITIFRQPFLNLVQRLVLAYDIRR
jgi:hypothetical protein